MNNVYNTNGLNSDGVWRLLEVWNSQNPDRDQGNDPIASNLIRKAYRLGEQERAADLERKMPLELLARQHDALFMNMIQVRHTDAEINEIKQNMAILDVRMNEARQQLMEDMIQVNNQRVLAEERLRERLANIRQQLQINFQFPKKLKRRAKSVRK
jgi:hypothetical protein